MKSNIDGKIEKNQTSIIVRFEDLNGPKLWIDGSKIAVLECSRRFLRLIGENRFSLENGVNVDGEVRYPTGRIIPVFGALVSHGKEQSYFELKTHVSNAAINRRNHFRISFNPSDALAMEVNKEIVSVEDISERGLQFVCPKEAPFKKNQEILGTLGFHNDKQYTIIGRIIRRLENRCTVKLARSIPYQHIMAEQAYLLRKYPRTSDSILREP
jgi:hypothetical protein